MPFACFAPSVKESAGGTGNAGGVRVPDLQQQLSEARQEAARLRKELADAKSGTSEPLVLAPAQQQGHAAQTENLEAQRSQNGEQGSFNQAQAQEAEQKLLAAQQAQQQAESLAAQHLEKAQQAAQEAAAAQRQAKEAATREGVAQKRVQQLQQEVMNLRESVNAWKSKAGASTTSSSELQPGAARDLLESAPASSSQQPTQDASAVAAVTAERDAALQRAEAAEKAQAASDEARTVAEQARQTAEQALEKAAAEKAAALQRAAAAEEAHAASQQARQAAEKALQGAEQARLAAEQAAQRAAAEKAAAERAAEKAAAEKAVAEKAAQQLAAESAAAAQRATAAERAAAEQQKAVAAVEQQSRSLAEVNASSGPSAREQLLIAQLEDSKRQIKALTSQVKELEEAREDLRRELERTVLEKASIQDAYDAVYDEAQEAHTAVLQLKAEVAELQAALGTAHLQSMAADQAAEHLTMAEAKVKESMERAQSLETRLEVLAAENNRMSEELRTLRQTSSKATVEITQKHSELVVTHGELRSAHDDLQQKWASLSSEHSTTQEQLTQTKQRLEAVQKEQAVALEQVEALRCDLRSHLLMSETTANQTTALLEDYQLQSHVALLRPACTQAVKTKYAALQTEMRMKDDMLELLQHQLAEVANIDLDSVLNEATATIRAAGRGSHAINGGAGVLAAAALAASPGKTPTKTAAGGKGKGVSGGTASASNGASHI